MLLVTSMNENTTVKDNVESLRETAANLKEDVSAFVDRGKETVDSIKSRVGDMSQSISENGAAVMKKASSFIEGAPVKAVAIAFGLGYLAMRIRTSPLLKFGALAGIGYLGLRAARD
jgi:ElaB/YqjD/DUF883 family membrane-anchored ribosome-binding protein